MSLLRHYNPASAGPSHMVWSGLVYNTEVPVLPPFFQTLTCPPTRKIQVRLVYRPI
ncbi:hypothetical protein SNOG_07343 [Parastagonospora nodorum SN15]|uniref:Uncharacterized protein n=1 Tax=Phaeosphaeria nodorum (strain SN15 / ATCC MYA-4574 / FGSC 10173) TaxID=321614 RepID=Q0ULM1_PHANO|nr:hypothetical protein SNOG_07343 [Parastagonospora nodorum SN15]EAT84809.1 hypothetical protein SNOG_07343 [Parastagonospora nodorum SN15]